MDNLIDEFKKTYEDYEIINLIGIDTWQIRLKSYDKIAVLKRVDNPDIYKKLQELKTQGIPCIYSVFEKDKAFYVIEEFISGSNLAEVMASEGCMSSRQVREIVLKLCNILAPVHSAGIVHRDIKPSNIILTSGREVYLIDFGIARLQNETSTGDTRHLGTEFYASPEQYGFAQTDNKSDIYSIGKLMIVLLTGKENAESLKGIPYSRIIGRCIEIDATKRYGNVSRLKAAFLIKRRTAVLLAVLMAFSLLGVGKYVAVCKTAADNKDVLKETDHPDSEAVTGDEKKTEATTEETSRAERTTAKVETTTAATTAYTTETTTAAPAANGLSEGKKPVRNEEKPAKAQNNSQSVSVQLPTEKTTEDNTQVGNYFGGFAVGELIYSDSPPAAEPVPFKANNYSIDKNGRSVNTVYTGDTNYYGYVFYGDGASDLNQFIDVDINIPKQTNKVLLARDGTTATLDTEMTDKGINISLNGNELFIAKSDDIWHDPFGEISPQGHIYTLAFYDIDMSGMCDIIVMDMMYFVDSDTGGVERMCAMGHIIKVNDDMSISLFEGDEIKLKSSTDCVELTMYDLRTYNWFGNSCVKFEITDDKVRGYF